MASVRVTLTVSGITEVEVRNGLPNLLDEFQQRPWIITPNAKWDTDRKLVVISVEYENSDIEGCKRAALDEVRDCLIACIQFSSEKISFEIEDTCSTPIA